MQYKSFRFCENVFRENEETGCEIFVQWTIVVDCYIEFFFSGLLLIIFFLPQTKKYADVIIPRGADNMGEILDFTIE